jgi:hypothetical protein
LSFPNRLSNWLIKDINEREHRKQLQNEILDRQIQSTFYEADCALDAYSNLIEKAAPFLSHSRIISLRSNHEQLAKSENIDPFRTTSGCGLAIQKLKEEIIAAKERNVDEYKSRKWQEAVICLKVRSSMIAEEIRVIDAVLSQADKNPGLMQYMLFEAWITNSKIKTREQLRDYMIKVNPIIINFNKIFELQLEDNPHRSIFLPV